MIAPGLSPGQLTFNGDLQLSTGTNVVIDVLGRAAGTGYDQLLVSGTAWIEGAVFVLHTIASVQEIGRIFPAGSAPASSVATAREGGKAVPRAALFPCVLAQTLSGKFAPTVINPSDSVVKCKVLTRVKTKYHPIAGAWRVVLSLCSPFRSVGIYRAKCECAGGRESDGRLLIACNSDCGLAVSGCSAPTARRKLFRCYFHNLNYLLM